MAESFSKYCTGCGACCKAVSHVEGFPKEFVLENGVCVNLQPDNSCAIYKTRPDICRVDKHYYQAGHNKKMSKRQYHGMQVHACMQLQQLFNVPQERRIK